MNRIFSHIISFCFLACLLLLPRLPSALVITSYLETRIIPNLGSAWTTITYENSYSNPPVIVCTYNLRSAASDPGLVRLNNVTTASFDVRVQVPLNLSTATPSDVYCTISEEGTYTSPIKYKAGRVVSDANGFASTDTENITPSDISFTNPVVTGQVMTFDEPDFSVFWSNN